MLVYRAINNYDLKKYNEGCNIESTMYTTTLELSDIKKNKKLKKKEREKFYRGELLFMHKRANALDTITGHISGVKLDSRTSPWISVSSDFSFVVREYAVPQSGKYNFQHERKPIIVINIDESTIYDTVDKVKSLRNSTENNIVVDLRNNKLSEYFDNDAVMCEKLNMDLPNYDISYDVNKDSNYKTKVNGFSNFATNSSELLIYGIIDKDKIEYVVYPLLQDILYSCNRIAISNTKNIIDDLNKYLNSLYGYLDSFYKELYPDITKGANLTDYLINNYNNILGNSIEEKYCNLKSKKLELLNIICNLLNKKFNLDLNPIRLIDDNILVSSYNNINNISDKQLNDLILIEDNGILYSYDNTTKKYMALNSSQSFIKEKNNTKIKIKKI